MKKKVCCWDLEGPITTIDFAADLSKKLSEKSKLGLNRDNMQEFYSMISHYDDYLVESPTLKKELGISEYQPGDTLRLMAPLYTSSLNEKILIKLARSNYGLLPGIQKLFNTIRQNWDVFIVSTSYTQFAYSVADFLGIPRNNVYATNFDINNLKGNLKDINLSIDFLVRKLFQEYLRNNKDLVSVIDNLNNFFWGGQNKDYVNLMNKIKVRGGKRKEAAIERISLKTEIPISKMIVLGDSITDINMLQRVKDEDGIAVSFNGNKFSIIHANVALTTPNSLGVLPIFEEYDHFNKFLENWE
ncbi:MAG: hypothetical protein ACFE9Z_09695, partial [Promethearchaeota archaeon]